MLKMHIFFQLRNLFFVKSNFLFSFQVPFCTQKPQEIQLQGREMLLDAFVDLAKGNTIIEFEQVSVWSLYNFKELNYVKCYIFNIVAII